MQLRLKITLVLLAVISMSVAANYAIQRAAVAPSFRTLEHEHALENWRRCANAIDRDQETLSALCFDWASWDDDYSFVQGKNPAFFDQNLKNEEWFVDQQIDVMYFCRPDGAVVWRHVLQLNPDEPATLAWLPADKLPAGHLLLDVQAEKESHVTGLMRTELGFVMFASRPILKSNNEGPLAGVLIFGRRLSDEAVASLRERTSVDFSILNAGDEALPPADRAGTARAVAAGTPDEELLDADRLVVRGVLNDLAGAPAVLLRTEGDRKITEEGRGAVNIATLSLVGAGLLTLVTLHAALRKMVISPLAALTRHATSVGEAGRATARVGGDRRDEIGTLARAYDRMLEQLEEFRVNAVSMSRRAGKAEVAAGVLHNVGNAMTNVNVLADTISGRVSRSKSANLSKVSALLEEHRADLPKFFAPGAQGEQLTGYITQLAAHLSQETAEVQRDLTGLREGLQHIRQIVASHQSIATSSNLLEAADLRDIAARSLTLVEESLRRHGVEVSLEGAGGEVTCDRSKLSQVIVNLLTNAKDALVAAGTQAPRILIRVGAGEGGSGVLEVCDNGPGFPAEHRDKAFSKGFTTKAQGHGIGLHYCWLSTQEMHGTLSLVDNAGIGGATFRLVLPGAKAERVAA